MWKKWEHREFIKPHITMLKIKYKKQLQANTSKENGKN